MEKPLRVRRGRGFGAGTFERRHNQGFQAITAFFVCSVAIGVLSLHHFGFGIAIGITLVAAVVCLALRMRPLPALYAVGCVLLASVLIAPNAATSPRATPAPPMRPLQTVDDAKEIYVLESPFFGDGQVRLKMYEPSPPVPAVDPFVRIPQPPTRDLPEMIHL